MLRMTTLRTVLACVAITTAATAAASAQSTWYVDDDAPNDPGPCDPLVSDPLESGSPDHPFDAIQEGINTAVSGDTVLVADGTYTGAGNKDLDFGGRLITVRSANGPETCIIDCQGTGKAFWFHTGETPAAVVDGFTLTDGWSASSGGMAIWSCATVANCIFSGNFALIAGGGACVSTTSGWTTLFAHCTFIDNSGGAALLGGGLFVESGSVALVNCDFRGNSANRGGGLSVWAGTATLTNCQFVQNSASQYGGAICLEEPGELPSVANCAFIENVAGLYGGGISAWDRYSFHTNVLVFNSTFAGNEAGGGRCLAANTAWVDWFVHNCVLWELDAVYCTGYCGFHPAFSDVMGYSGGVGNIDADPLYVNQSADDYRLRPGSPCIDAANNTYVLADTLDLDGDGDTSERTPFDRGGNPRFVDDPHTADTGVGDPPTYPQVVDMGAYEFQAIPGDLDGDLDVDFADFEDFTACVSGPDVSFPPGCGAADLNHDGDIDLDDFQLFQRQFTGPLP